MNNFDNIKSKLNNFKNLKHDNDDNRNHEINELKKTINDLFDLIGLDIAKPSDNLFDKENENKLRIYIDYLLVMINDNTFLDISNNIDKSINNKDKIINEIHKMDKETKKMAEDLSINFIDPSNIIPQMNNIVDNLVKDLYTEYTNGIKNPNTEESDIEEFDIEELDIDKELNILQEKILNIEKNSTNLKNNQELKELQTKLSELIMHNFSKSIVDDAFDNNPKLNEFMKMME